MRSRSLLAPLVVALALTSAGSATANPFDYLDVNQLQGGALSYGGDPYYSATPWIWVTSSDGESYDGFHPREMTFRVSAAYEYTAAPFFQETTKKLRIRGGGFSEVERTLQDGTNSYVTDYLPPQLEYTPVEMCNQALPSQGPDALETGFVLLGQNAYEIHGWIQYKNEWSQSQTVSDTIQSDVYILCAGDAKPFDGEAPDPAPPSPTPTPAGSDLSPGFVISNAQVKIAPAYDGLVTPSCPVTVPIVLEFAGTAGESFSYRVVTASGGTSSSLTGTLSEGPGGGFVGSREIQIIVPAAPSLDPAADDLVVGGSSPPPTQGPVALQGTGGGGGAPDSTSGPAAIQVEAHDGVYAESYRIEVQSPNQLSSDYVGYHITCASNEPEPVAIPNQVQVGPVVEPPPAPSGFAAPPSEPPPAIGQLQTPSAEPARTGARSASPRGFAPAPTGQLEAPKQDARPPSRREASTSIAAVRPAVPMLVFDKTREASGRQLTIDATRTKRGAGRGRNLCQLSGLRIEWPGDTTPELRVAGRSVQPARRVPGTVSVLILPELDLEAGPTPLEASAGATRASWRVNLRGSCEAAPPQRTAPDAQEPNRPTPAAEERSSDERREKGFHRGSRD